MNGRPSWKRRWAGDGVLMPAWAPVRGTACSAATAWVSRDGGRGGPEARERSPARAGHRGPARCLARPLRRRSCRDLPRIAPADPADGRPGLPRSVDGWPAAAGASSWRARRGVRTWSSWTAGRGDRPSALRLRRAEGLLDLPWELPLADWPDTLAFRELDVGPSRHLVRFLVVGAVLLALKEEPIDVARREYAVLGHLERVGLPAVLPVGIAEHEAPGSAILVTEYLAQSLQFRRLLARFPLGPGPYRTRLLDAMAWLLVDLHRGGVFWGDCSLANTLFRRDGDRIQAFLVDAETSEIHPGLSDGQRAFDLDILVENVGYGLADVAALQDRREDFDDAVEAAEAVRERYHAIWHELHFEPPLPAGDRHAIRTRLRHLNDLGFAVEEIEVVPQEAGSEVRLRVRRATARFTPTNCSG